MGPRLVLKLLFLVFFRTDSTIKKILADALGTYTRLNTTLRVDSFQPSQTRAGGLEFEKVNHVFALEQLIGPDLSSGPSRCTLSLTKSTLTYSHRLKKKMTSHNSEKLRVIHISKSSELFELTRYLGLLTWGHLSGPHYEPIKSGYASGPSEESLR